MAGRASTAEPLPRSEVPAGDRWDVEALYASDSEWERDFERTASFAEEMSRWTGRLGESPSVLRSAIEEMLDQERLLSRLVVYASMKRDEDLSNGEYGSMFSRISSRLTEIATAHSFFRPELLSIPKARMDSWLESEELAPYVTWLGEILRYRPHTLTGPEERIVSMTHEVSRGFSTAFGQMNNVDIPARLPEVQVDEGETVRITNANLGRLLQNRERDVRKSAFTGYYEELTGNVATLAALLEGQVRSHVFYARVRDYDSALSASLFRDRVPVSVYDTLIDTVHENMPTLHGYYSLRGRVLDLEEEMHLYDSYVPVVEEAKGDYTWDEAVDLTLEAVSPLGEEYVSLLEKGLREQRWADRYENRGKRAGAYSSGCYDSFPYILHNFNGTLRSVFTLAHEAGHSMHTLLSSRAQPYHLSDYRILVAEVASTTNEMLLVDLLMRRLEDDRTRAYLVDHLLGNFRSTLYRQTMFAEFERAIHERVEAGDPMPPDWLHETYGGLVRSYHGDAFSYDDVDRLISREWARIPHFYYNFYVYKYATGLASAVDISRRILAGEEGAVESYMEFLSGGCSKPPLDLLRGAGVDLETPEPVSSALGFMAERLSDLEGMLLG